MGDEKLAATYFKRTDETGSGRDKNDWALQSDVRAEHRERKIIGEWLVPGVDGLDVRISCHSSRTGCPESFGFNEAVIAAGMYRGENVEWQALSSNRAFVELKAFTGPSTRALFRQLTR